MLLNAAMCFIVLSKDFKINIFPKILCPEDMFRANHELQQLQKTVLLFFLDKGEGALLSSDNCSPQESLLLRCEDFSQCIPLCKTTNLVCPSQRTTKQSPFMLGKRTRLQPRKKQASVFFIDDSRCILKSYSGRLLTWRKQRTKYHQSKNLETHRYQIWWNDGYPEISVGGHTDIHVFYREL